MILSVGILQVVRRVVVMIELNKAADKTKSYTIASFFNHYIQGIEADTVYDVPYSMYRQIVTEYFQYLRDQILEESKEVKLPYRLGSVQIVKKRPKHLDGRSLRIDYQATKELNKLIFLTNEHSDYFKYRVHWCKHDVIVPNKGKYQLVMTRANKRHLAQLIKNKIHDYQEID